MLVTEKWCRSSTRVGVVAHWSRVPHSGGYPRVPRHGCPLVRVPYPVLTPGTRVPRLEPAEHLGVCQRAVPG
eukprot:1325640-Rhodomonas_salina.2